ncbi:MAG: Branched-chain amino acid transport ATP-binding protein LivF, partial [uncultured Craurococcus sp.]
ERDPGALRRPCRLWRLPGALRHRPPRRAGRGRGRRRAERRRQDHPAPRHLRPDPPDRRQPPLRRDGPGGDARPSPALARHRPCAGEPPPLPAPHGRGEPEGRRLLPCRPRAFRRAARPGLRPLPPHEAAPPPARRHPLGRRAADVRHRPRADVRPAHPAARRALGRPRPDRREAGLRPGAEDPRGGADGADRRAERGAGAARRRPRLCAGDRPRRRRGPLGRSRRRPGHPPQLSWRAL